MNSRSHIGSSNHVNMSQYDDRESNPVKNRHLLDAWKIKDLFQKGKKIRLPIQEK